MNSTFIQELIPVRMQELGHGTSYKTEMQTLNLIGNETRELAAWNSLVFFPMDYFLIGFPVTVESNFGLLDMVGRKHNRQAFEHTGKITLKNTANTPQQVTYFWVRPHC